ncbi:MAG: CoA transferase [Gracilibacteraceae bacterium]|jgi:crotonobetainyl-CoA:carnitine CoA-transferase CaiB-like acyl-CoA transferase|nr:CoA transferase [Gracilibacteraceae bacterium]
MAKVLEGIRILEWSMLQQGPAAGAILADLGAEVIKIETPGAGDNARYLKITQWKENEIADGNTFYFDGLNRNKKGITLNLKTEEGRQLLYKMTAKVDVFLHNYRPGVPEKMKADYETLKQYNPKLIYAQASGLGSQGPDAGQATVDLVGVARSGVMNAIGFEGEAPGYVAWGFGDQTGAVFTAFGVVTALLARERLGVAQRVDASLTRGLANLNTYNMLYYAWTRQNPLRHSLKAPALATSNYYKCKDGKWIMLGVYLVGGVKRFFELVGRYPEIAANEKYTTQHGVKEDGEFLAAKVQEILSERDRAEWLEFFARNDFSAGIVATYEDVFEDPMSEANEVFVDYLYEATGQKVRYLNIPFALSETPGRIERCSPRLGQHNQEVYAELCGLSVQEITDLQRRKII